MTQICLSGFEPRQESALVPANDYGHTNHQLRIPPFCLWVAILHALDLSFGLDYLAACPIFLSLFHIVPLLSSYLVNVFCCSVSTPEIVDSSVCNSVLWIILPFPCLYVFAPYCASVHRASTKSFS